MKRKDDNNDFGDTQQRPARSQKNISPVRAQRVIMVPAYSPSPLLHINIITTSEAIVADAQRTEKHIKIAKGKRRKKKWSKSQKRNGIAAESGNRKLNERKIVEFRKLSEWMEHAQKSQRKLIYISTTLPRLEITRSKCALRTCRPQRPLHTHTHTLRESASIWSGYAMCARECEWVPSVRWGVAWNSGCLRSHCTCMRCAWPSIVPCCCGCTCTQQLVCV